MQHEQLSLLTLTPEPGPATAPKIPPCHSCHVPGCNVPISLTMLMCIKHWLKVPKDLQREVWRYYRPGQEEDKQPSAEYLAAARAAIQSVLPPAPVATGAAEGAQALEEPVIEPRAARFLFGDRVFIVTPQQGRTRTFIPWEGCEGVFCGINAIGLGLVDFGVGLLYPVAIERLSFTTEVANADAA